MSSVIDSASTGSAGPFHAVHFYETDERLYPLAAQFLATGLREGDAVIVIATREHRKGLRASVEAANVDVDRAIRSGQFTLIDAREAMSMFMLDGLPSEERFHDVIGGLVQRISSAWRGRVRAYGEMVNLLWQDGNPEAAIRLEELWNDLLGRRDSALLCAYAMGNFYKESSSESLADVCSRHTALLPAEFAALTPDVEIAYRKQLETALRGALAARTKAERDLRDFVQHAPVGLHWVAADGTILWANDAELDLLGYPREEYAGHNIREFYIDRGDVEDILRRLANHEEIRDREVRLRAKNGSTKYALVTSNAKFENGEFVHTRCFTRDVTQLHTEQQKFKRLIDSNIIGIYTRDEEGRILEANEAYLQLIGYNHSDVETGRLRWADVTPPEYFHRDRAAVEEIHQRGACTPYEKELIRADGTRIPVLVGAARLNGGRTHIAYAIDLTERKTAERDATFLAEASDIVARTLDSNAVLRSIAELFVPRFAEYCFVDVRRNDGTFERIATAGDEPRAVAEGQSLTVTLSARGATFGLIGFIGSATRRPFDKRDLTLAQEVARRAALAIDNARLYESAQNANRAKDEFLATLSHELRTPMTAILGWSRFLQIGSIDRNTMNNAIEAINRAAVTQAQLIDDVLDMSRIISGKLRLDLQPVDLAGIINAAVETVRPTMTAKQIALHVNTHKTEDLILADPNRLQQAMWNLLTNAAKFTPADGRVSVAVRTKGPRAFISVRDNGQGIEPEFLPHVFERFRQGESTAARTHGGLGLGLAIVRYIIEMHGGSITAASEGLGKGSTFTIELPVLAGVTMKEETKSENFCDLSGMKVLFVDDEADTRTFVRAVLEHCGAEVKTCQSAAEAVAAVAAWHPDAVITDIAMPETDGRALYEQLSTLDWKDAGAPPILALSASGLPKAHDRFTEYLTKPIDPMELAHAVRRAVPR